MAWSSSHNNARTLLDFVTLAALACYKARLKMLTAPPLFSSTGVAEVRAGVFVWWVIGLLIQFFVESIEASKIAEG